MIDEKGITKLLAAGDYHAGFNAIVSQYSKAIYWRVRGVVKEHNDADEVVQLVFIKIWKGLPKFRGDSALFSWIYRIAYNESISFIRAEKKFRDHQAPIESASTFSADAHHDLDSIEHLFHEAIESLPERQREVFLVRYYNETKFDDLAQSLELSTGAVKASYHHASEKIKEYIRNHERKNG